MSRLTSAAHLVSVVFHPLIVPAIAFLFLIFLDRSVALFHQVLYFGVAVCFSVVLIPLYIYWLSRRGAVDSMDINMRQQRLNPLLIGALSYFIGFVALALLGAPPLVRGLMWCYATNTLLITVITRWWKVSVHTTAIGGPLAALFLQFGAVVLPFFLLVPVIGGARVVLQRHTVAQVIVGGCVGLGLTALQLALFFRP